MYEVDISLTLERCSSYKEVSGQRGVQWQAECFNWHKILRLQVKAQSFGWCEKDTSSSCLPVWPDHDCIRRSIWTSKSAYNDFDEDCHCSSGFARYARKWTPALERSDVMAVCGIQWRSINNYTTSSHDAIKPAAKKV